MMLRVLTSTAFGLGTALTVAAAATESKLSFNEDIQPILSGHCFHCHGPDAAARKGELRLDRAEFAYLPRKDGRDHHPNCFTTWLAGAGVKRGFSLGASDEFGFNGVKDRVHVHDLNATILHLLGFDHTRLTYRFQGRDFRLTDVHGEIVKGILA